MNGAHSAFPLAAMAASLGPSLLVAALATPAALLAACLSRRLRSHALALLPVAPAAALAAALLALGGEPFGFDLPLLRVSLAIDAPGAILLGVCALLWIAAGAYARADLRGKPDAAPFAVSWLLTLAGSIGVVIAAHLLTFYLVFALVSIPAYGLVAHKNDAGAVRASGIYMAFAMLGEALLLMGFALLAAGEPNGSLAIRDVVAALPGSPWRDAALALAIAGFGVKIALVPVHGWMPLAHTAAPVPASAILSGAVIKAGVIGLIRFLPFDTALTAWGEGLAAVGLFSAFYGVAIGITQRNPKTVLAYSSVSQMGMIAAVLGMGLAAGDTGATLGAAFYAAHHVLVKGALFLAVGVAAAGSRRRLWLVLPPALVLALSLGGLPLTGGALAKFAVKAPLGNGLIGALAAWSAAGTTLLMLHFLLRVARSASPDTAATAPPGLAVPWLTTALASVIVPWLLFPATGGQWAAALTPDGVWEALWPVLIGTALALPLCRFGERVPRVPAGDIVGAGESAFRASFALGGAFDRVDGLLRRWPAAALSFVTLAIVFGAAMLTRL
jgi:formate hydrogenlyase subunit 3/multisubunit Na+/H+ antiporter MnhD subunit